MPADGRVLTDARLLTWLALHGDSVDRFNKLAARKGVHPAQLGHAWVRYSPGVTTPIVGVSSLRQLESSLGAFALELSPEEYETITGLFETEVKEEGFQRFPGLKYNFPRLRRNLNLIQ